MKITCVVVTYNRISLLKENMAALKKQTYLIHQILIVDNNSTDGTKEYLQQFATDVQVKVLSLPRNIGGAGGFSAGIKEAVIGGSDWVWIMDDDTIPQEDALEKLVAATQLTDRVGYVASKVVWTDGAPHHMNLPGFCYGKKFKYPINQFSQKDLSAYIIQKATFVSLLISAAAVREVGLPISDFFIWHDDIEYTLRIYAKGYDCFYVDNSVVLHKTSTNFLPHPHTAPIDTAWKFYYQARNTSYMKRVKTTNFFHLLFYSLNKYRRYMRLLNRRTDGNKHLFEKQIRKGCWDGLFFDPKIEYLPK